MSDSKKSTEIYDLSSLLERLRSEHKPGYVYRGQIRVWPGALLPSIYRGQTSEYRFTNYDPKIRLYEIGETFHELDPIKSFAPGKEIEQRMMAIDYLKQTFGFPLSQLLAQQFGINSECLDVTSDPEIAAYFATHSVISGTHTIRKNEPGVIYRFKVHIDKLELQVLKSVTFYTCPYYLDALNILSSLGTCSSWKDAAESFMNYGFQSIMVLSGKGPYTRPLELLKLPSGAIKQSRVVKQKSGLLFPDMILSTFYGSLRISPPPGKAEKEGMAAVEDLHGRAGLDIFLFEHSLENRRILRIHTEDLFPKTDPFYQLLCTFLTSSHLGHVVYQTEMYSLSSGNSWNFIY